MVGRLADWSLRKAFVASVCCLIAFQEDLYDLVTFGGKHTIAPAFIGFVSVMVHDETLGATCRHGWSCLLGCMCAVIIVWLILAILLPSSSPYAALPLLALSTFCYDYMGFASAMGKKVGISLIAMFLVSNDLIRYTELTHPIYQTLYIAFDVLVGVIIAVSATLLPPSRMAGVDFGKQAKFGASAMARVFEDLVIGWQHQPYSEPGRTEKADVTDSDAVALFMDRTKSTDPYSRWRRFKVFWRCLMALKGAIRTPGPHELAWLHTSRAQIREENRALRAELVEFVYEKLSVMALRIDEAKWGPLRLEAMAIYTPFLRLLKRLLLVTTVMERQLALMDNLIRGDKNGTTCAIFGSFHASPAFRSSLRAYTSALTTALLSLADFFAAKARGKGEEAYGGIPGILARLRESIQELRRLYEAFDQAYYDARIHVYYRKRLPISSPVFMNMNGFLYYNGWTVSLIENFVNDCDNFYAMGEDRAFNYFCALLGDMVRDQSPYFAFWNDRGELDPPLKLRRRLLSSLTLAMSMPIGGYYGLAAGRQQPFMAAFTIAYLSGGSVTGMNLVTSINRALGTVLACIYTLLVILCVDGIEARGDGGAADANIFISIAVILFQVPCTLLRAQPILSYTGTVASFSSILLLLSGSALNSSVAIDRIIDTFVGIIIFLSLELAVSTTDSEFILLEDLADTTAGIDERFSHFLRGFQAESGEGGTGVADGATRNSHGQSHSEPDFSVKRVLLTYNDAEPASFFRVEKLPRRYLENALSQLQGCHQGISSLSMIHGLDSHGKGNDKGNKSDAGLRRSMHVLLRPLLPPLHRLRFVLHKTCLQLRKSFLRLSVRTRSPLLLKTFMAQLRHVARSVSTRRGDGAGSRADTEAKSLSIPTPCPTLSASSIKALFYDEADAGACVGSTISATIQGSLSGFQGAGEEDSEEIEEETHEHDRPGNQTEGWSGGILEELERGQDALFSAFEQAVSSLQRVPSQADLTRVGDVEDLGEGESPARGMSMTNAEAKAVAAYLSGTSEIISNLKALTISVRKMESYRVIRLGARCKKHF